MPTHGQSSATTTATGGRSSTATKSGQHFVAGLTSGVTSALLLQPLDLLKTRVQQRGHISASSWMVDIVGSKGSVTTAATLWRGVVPSVLRTGFGSAMYFSALDLLRKKGRESPGALQNAHVSNLAAGAAARTIAGFATMPLTIIKVRFESNLYSYQSMRAAANSIYADGGLRAFFAGFGATAARDGPHAGLYVLFYEISRTQLGRLVSPAADRHTPRLEGEDIPHATPSAAINFGSGIVAGAICSTISNPFDAIKTRIQLSPHQYRNMLQACRKMTTEEGLGTFFDGLALRLSRKALSSALAWTLYEELIRAFK